MKHERVLERLGRQIAEAGSRRKWAMQHGISAQYVGDVMLGKRPPGPMILKALGLERRVEFAERRLPP